MLKGAQKQLIVIRTVNSPYFDEAYFVLRREISPKVRSHSDILAEANRILEENILPSARQKKSRKYGLWFLLGLLCGAVCAISMCFIFF